MKMEITGRRVVITAAIRSYVTKRLRKFDRLCGDDTSFHVILDVEKERHTAEILLKSRLLELAGKGETDDMYSSIVRAIEKLERQVIHSKSRLIDGKRQKAKARSVEQKYGLPRPAGIMKPVRSVEIVEEGLPKRPLAVEDAVAELGQSEYSFVAFRNVESGSMNILYRRKDGSLGLIQE
jgi:putative sigma-54 modulation protein